MMPRRAPLASPVQASLTPRTRTLTLGGAGGQADPGSTGQAAGTPMTCRAAAGGGQAGPQAAALPRPRHPAAKSQAGSEGAHPGMPRTLRPQQAGMRAAAAAASAVMARMTLMRSRAPGRAGRTPTPARSRKGKTAGRAWGKSRSHPPSCWSPCPGAAGSRAKAQHLQTIQWHRPPLSPPASPSPPKRFPAQQARTPSSVPSPGSCA